MQVPDVEAASGTFGISSYRPILASSSTIPLFANALSSSKADQIGMKTFTLTWITKGDVTTSIVGETISNNKLAMEIGQAVVDQLRDSKIDQIENIVIRWKPPIERESTLTWAKTSRLPSS